MVASVQGGGLCGLVGGKGDKGRGHLQKRDEGCVGAEHIELDRCGTVVT